PHGSQRRALRARGHRAASARSDRADRAQREPPRPAIAQLRLGPAAGPARRGDPGPADLRRAAPLLRRRRGDATTRRRGAHAAWRGPWLRLATGALRAARLADVRAPAQHTARDEHGTREESPLALAALILRVGALRSASGHEIALPLGCQLR